MPKIIPLKTKVQEIIVLRAVSNVVNENNALLLDWKQQMMNIFKSIYYRQHNMFKLTPDESSNSDTKSVLFHQRDSRSKTTIQRYKGPPQSGKWYISIVIIISPTTKVEHPFVAEENYLSKYPVNFIEYYCFGSTNNYITKDWYIAI